MKIIAYALVIVNMGSEHLIGDEKSVTFWRNLNHCLYMAQELSRTRRHYRPVSAYCQPVSVDPTKVTLQSIITRPKPKPENEDE